MKTLAPVRLVAWILCCCAGMLSAPAAGQDPLPAFGYDAFQSASTITDGPVDDQYLVSPGDEIVVSVWGALNETLNLTVSEQGFLELPEKAGRIQTNGVTLRELKPLVERSLGEIYAGYISAAEPAKSTAFVDIRLGKIRPLLVYVVGEVNKPGPCSIGAPVANVVNVISNAGGVRPSGSLREVRIRRNDGTVDVVDLYGFLIDGTVDWKALRLRPGDYVIVPLKRKSVTVGGEVRRPAVYELVKDEGVREAVALAGGPGANASLRRAQLVRTEPNRGEVYVDLDLEAALSSGGPNVPLQDRDVLTIGRNVQLRKNMVSIRGDGIMRPGTYEWRAGMKLSDLVAKGEGLREHAYLERADLVRTDDDFSKRLVKFPLQGLFDRQADGSFRPTGDAALDFPLREMDEVIVQSRWGLAGRDKAVTLEGHVKEPGTVDLAKGMTLHDLLFMRGGFQDPEFAKRTYMDMGHVVRPAPGPTGTRMVTFNLGELLAQPEGRDFALEEGDVVRIYAAADLAGPRTVQIDGLVNKPGTYPMSDGLTVEDLVILAGGFRPDVVRPEALVARPLLAAGSGTAASRSQESIAVAIPREVAATPREGRTPLQASDRVSIRHAAGWEPLDVASVGGEVRHPGSYTLPRERQHLSDLVALAGGVADDAFPEAATLTRVEFVPGSGAAGVSTSVAIDLAAAIRQPHGAADIEVRDGDVLTIPRSSGVVVVRGAVQRPMTLQHRPGATLQDYLGLAGGLGLRADASRITITAPNSTASLVARGQNPVLMAGSAIDVPLQRADERLRVVEVKGAVATPAVVQFTDGARLSYYVGVCGGFAASADLDRIVVLTPDGGMLARDGAKEFNPDVPPGSIIVVTSKAPAIPAADAK